MGAGLCLRLSVYKPPVRGWNPPVIKHVPSLFHDLDNSRANNTVMMYIPGSQNRRKQEGAPIPNSMSTHQNGGALGVFAATLNSGYTLVLIEHKARLTEAAFFADGGGSEAFNLTVLIQVGAGWDTGREAVGVVAVVWAFQNYGVEGNGISA